jgi:hypothetical protein
MMIDTLESMVECMSALRQSAWKAMLADRERGAFDCADIRHNTIIHFDLLIAQARKEIAGYRP